MLAPSEEPTDGVHVGRPRVFVADGGGEEFQEATRGMLAGVGDDRRHDDLGCDGAGDPQLLVGWDDGQRLPGFRFAFGHGPSVTLRRLCFTTISPGSALSYNTLIAYS
jgi:hypothetical protein